MKRFSDEGQDSFLNSPLFTGMKREEAEAALKRCQAALSTYRKGERILRAGERISRSGIVVSGMVHIIREDFWGNKSILSEAGAGQLFGEVYALLETEPLSVSVEAVQDTEVLFLELNRLFAGQEDTPEGLRLASNLMRVLAAKNLMLSRKIEHISGRTTRERLISYLSWQSGRCGSSSFEIPFNRQQLADYLCVDRSAMSYVLCKLRDEGILEFEKNKFVLKEGDGQK